MPLFDRAAIAALLAVLAATGLVVEGQARAFERAGVGLGEATARATRARAAATDLARAFARPSVEVRLAEAATHLPPSATLLALGERASGAPYLEVATRDPDALRDALAGDRWFAPYRERGQQMDEGGAVRVLLDAASD